MEFEENFYYSSYKQNAVFSMEDESVSDEKNDVLTIWIPLIGAFIMFVAVLIISTNFDNDFYSDTGSRLFEPGFNVLLGIVLSVAMFFIFRSSGIKKAKKAERENVERDRIFVREKNNEKNTEND